MGKRHTELLIELHPQKEKKKKRQSPFISLFYSLQCDRFLTKFEFRQSACGKSWKCCNAAYCDLYKHLGSPGEECNPGFPAYTETLRTI